MTSTVSIQRGERLLVTCRTKGDTKFPQSVPWFRSRTVLCRGSTEPARTDVPGSRTVNEFPAGMSGWTFEGQQDRGSFVENCAGQRGVPASSAQENHTLKFEGPPWEWGRPSGPQTGGCHDPKCMPWEATKHHPRGPPGRPKEAKQNRCWGGGDKRSRCRSQRITELVAPCFPPTSMGEVFGRGLSRPPSIPVWLVTPS